MPRVRGAQAGHIFNGECSPSLVQGICERSSAHSGASWMGFEAWVHVRTHNVEQRGWTWNSPHRARVEVSGTALEWSRRLRASWEAQHFAPLSCKAELAENHARGPSWEHTLRAQSPRRAISHTAYILLAWLNVQYRFHSTHYCSHCNVIDCSISHAKLLVRGQSFTVRISFPKANCPRIKISN